MKRIMAVFGFIIAVLGMCAVDQSIIGGALLMLSGGLLMYPDYRQFERERRHGK